MAEQEYFVISVAAELTGMHAQTLRTYDRMGLVTPMRTSGGGRRYSSRDISLLRDIQRLSQEEGVNLAGIKTILELSSQIDELQERLASREAEVEQLRAAARAATAGGAGGASVTAGRELVHVPRSTAVVAWRPRSARRRQRG